MSEILTYENWDDERAAAILGDHPDYLDVLKWAFREYGDSIVYACSFGAEGIVLIDLIHKVHRQAKIIFLDTGLHFPETYALIEDIKGRFPSLDIRMAVPKASVAEQAKWYGEELWKENPNLCCHLRKVVPLQEALGDAKAWISGLRREQSVTRRHVQYVNQDHKFRKIKICPLINWSWNEIMTYLHLNNLPYNPLHDKGYPSIGCAPCTRAVTAAEDPRAGRWAGLQKTECGLHENQ